MTRLAAIDLGSNSFHLLIVEQHEGARFEPLAKEKEMLRLGDAVARTGRIGPELADKAVATLMLFQQMIAAADVDYTVAAATAAIRDAEDGSELVDRILAECGLEVKVVSGQREAALIFRAVSAAVAIDPGPALAADLGGGSLELMIGDHQRLEWATSLPLGVGRLSARVQDDPPSEADRRRLLRVVERELDVAARRLRDKPVEMLIGSSGTLLMLVRMAAAVEWGSVPENVNQLDVPRRALEEVHRRLWTTTASARARLEGMDANRVDLAPAGSLVALELLELAGVEHLVASEWAMREGMILEICEQLGAALPSDASELRRRSVESLAQRYSAPEPHSSHVSELVDKLAVGLSEVLGLDEADRELLWAAARLHDVGEHVSTDGHERHGAYLVANSALPGFSPDERQVLACLVRFHRRGSLKRAYEPFGQLGAEHARRVEALVALLRVADGLDRSRLGPVSDLCVHPLRSEDREVVVTIGVEPGADASLEIWGLRRKGALLARLLGRSLRTEVRHLGAEWLDEDPEDPVDGDLVDASGAGGSTRCAPPSERPE
jgi:exopolyphosphatase/guanosine-5'-triphosphate,3'-diphosphate pyrophosphatase